VYVEEQQALPFGDKGKKIDTNDIDSLCLQREEKRSAGYDRALLLYVLDWEVYKCADFFMSEKIVCDEAFGGVYSPVILGVANVLVEDH